MIEKLSGNMGVDKSFWMDFENSVLSELRATVEEVDPIEWLMSIADSNTGYANSNGSTSASGKSQTSQHAPRNGNDWDSLEEVLGTLADINQMTKDK